MKHSLLTILIIFFQFNALGQDKEPVGKMNLELAPADAAILNDWITDPRGALAIRRFLETGRGQVGNKTLSCDQATEPDRCNLIAAWVCQRATWKRRDLAKGTDDLSAQFFSDNVLNGFLMSNDEAQTQFYEAAHALMRQSPAPNAPTRIAELQRKIYHVNALMTGRENMTSSLRGLIGASVDGYLATQNRIKAISLELEHTTEAARRTALQDEMTHMMNASGEHATLMRRSFLQAFGHPPSFSLATSQEGKVYVAFDLEESDGTNARVVVEVTARGFREGGPTFVPVAFEPVGPVRVPTRNLGKRFACFLGTQGKRIENEIAAQPVVVQMPNSPGFVAYHLLGEQLGSAMIYPEGVAGEFQPTYIDPYVLHPAELMPHREKPIDIDKIKRMKEAAPAAPANPAPAPAAPAAPATH